MNKFKSNSRRSVSRVSSVFSQRSAALTPAASSAFLGGSSVHPAARTPERTITQASARRASINSKNSSKNSSISSSSSSGSRSDSSSSDRSSSSSSSNSSSRTGSSSSKTSGSNSSSSHSSAFRAPQPTAEVSPSWSSADLSAADATYGPHLSILCLNAFLIPPFVSWNPYLWAPFWSCKRPNERAEQIGRLCAQYDLVCLQEVWGANLKGLNACVLPTHSILPETQASGVSSLLSGLVDPVCLYTRKTGGLWFAWRLSKISYLDSDRRMFSSESRVPFSQQNITAVYLDVSKVFNKMRLIAVGTHFSVLGRQPRSANLHELKIFIKEIAWKQYLLWLGRQLVGSAYTPGDKQSLSPPSFIADTALLLMGDFNLDPKRCPKDYQRLCSLGGCAQLRDLFLPEDNPNYNMQYTRDSQEGRYTTTNKDGSVHYKGNSLFPWPFKGRVDYLFGVDGVYLTGDEVLNLVEKFPPEEVVGPEFEDMDIPVLKEGGLAVTFQQIHCLGMDIIAQHYGEELSDHWPLSARICIGAPRVQQQQLPRPRKQQLLRGLSLCVDASYKGSSSNQKKNQLTKKVIEAEKQLAANQLAGWRQSRAPSILEQTPEVKRLQQQREQYKRAAAAAAAEAAKAAAAEAAATAAAAAAEKEAAAEAERKALWEQQKQREPQQQQQQLEQQMQQMSITQEDSGVGVDDQQQTAGQQDAAAASASHAAGEDKAKKSVPLAAQRAREAMKARRKPLRM